MFGFLRWRGVRRLVLVLVGLFVVVVVVVVDGISEVKEKGCLGTVVEALVVWGRRGAGT